ncbi:hypothetical protein EV421DRAFT_1714458 [Armillaria borealis]|uniref:Uncharacterized protein n=1 Tax=Armillaria borealis TaxID=47425 RepID=A0AA39ML12_9AGAR|nr:hypothetical protein EV421DRAFT_1714458 [Armillaria borealis]
MAARIVRLFNKSALARIFEGPSMNVTCHGLGGRNSNDESDDLLIWDRATPIELDNLHGVMRATGVKGQEVDHQIFPTLPLLISLWPEDASVNSPGKSYGGIWNLVLDLMFQSIHKEIMDGHRLKVRCRSQWTDYVRSFFRKNWAKLAFIPSEQDVELGTAIIKDAYSVSWNGRAFDELTVPVDNLAKYEDAKEW